MDIQLLGKDSLKIKSKRTTIAVDLKSALQKIDADAVLIIDKTSDATRVNGSRITIDGVGEYEISGLKVSGIKSDKDIMYGLSSETMDAIVAKASALEKIPADKIGEYQIAIINVDSDLNQSVVTSIEPRVVVLYGEKAREGAKVLGKEEVTKTAKITITEEKLPEEMDVILLG